MDRLIAAPAAFLATGLLAAVCLAADTAAPAAPETASQAPAAAIEPDQKPDLLLMPSHDPRCRSQELEQVARQADAHARYGFELAGRKALFSAKAEFVMALRLLAQGLDAEYRTQAHSRTLAAGLIAIDEADDFIPQGSSLEADLDLPAIIRAHRTPVLHGAACEKLSPVGAIDCYLTFAQQQLGFAAGGEVAGSIALYGLGKLHKTMAEEAVTGVRGARSAAMVYYQASLLALPQNYLAANDLGVLLAQSGRYEGARAALERSVSICPEPSACHNLAVVYSQLGQHEAARQATLLAEKSDAGRPNSAAEAVQWVDPAKFAQAAGQPVPTPRK